MPRSLKSTDKHPSARLSENPALDCKNSGRSQYFALLVALVAPRAHAAVRRGHPRVKKRYGPIGEYGWRSIASYVFFTNSSPATAVTNPLHLQSQLRHRQTADGGNPLRRITSSIALSSSDNVSYAACSFSDNCNCRHRGAFLQQRRLAARRKKQNLEPRSKYPPLPRITSPLLIKSWHPLLRANQSARHREY